jgi:hypothetical protein
MKIGERGYVQGDRLMFKFSNFLAQETFNKNYPTWLSDAKASLVNHDWSSGFFNVGIISRSWALLGSESVNMNVTGLNPAGCLQRGSDSFYLIRLLSDCKLGVYVQAIHGNSEEYARYVLVGTVDVKSNPVKVVPTPRASVKATPEPTPNQAKTPKPTPSSSSNQTQSKSKKTTITCIKGKLTKKVTAVSPKCPAGYKKK